LLTRGERVRVVALGRDNRRVAHEVTHYAFANHQVRRAVLSPVPFAAVVAVYAMRVALPGGWSSVIAKPFGTVAIGQGFLIPSRRFRPAE